MCIYHMHVHHQPQGSQLPCQTCLTQTTYYTLTSAVSPPCTCTPGRLPGRSLLQRLRANDRVCRGRVGRDCKGTGNWDSFVNQGLWAQTAAITNTLVATEWAATKAPAGTTREVTRYNNAQLNCVSARDWECLSTPFLGRKLLRGKGTTAARR